MSPRTEPARQHVTDASIARTTERELIERFVGRFPRPPADVRVGPGDDCAVVSAAGPLCVTTDAAVEGVHFELSTFSAEDVGHKALAANLSDLASMGARPAWFVCALGLPVGLPDAWVDGLARGMAALAREHRIALVGGNVTASPVVSITLTLAGEVPGGGATLRGGARAGELLYVSGTLGDARLGLEALRAGQRRGALVERQRRPTPRVELGRRCAPHVSAAIDLSDGFGHDLSQLCEASGVGARIEVPRLPLSKAARRVGVARARTAALRGGEDYELLLAVPSGRAPAVERLAARLGERLTRVGELTAARGLVLVGSHGAELPAVPDGGSAFVGFDHRDRGASREAGARRPGPSI